MSAQCCTLCAEAEAAMLRRAAMLLRWPVRACGQARAMLPRALPPAWAPLRATAFDGAVRR